LLEFRHALAGRRLTVLEGRCVPNGVTIPYLPVIELLRASCGLTDPDTPDEAATKLRHALEEVGLEPRAHRRRVQGLGLVQELEPRGQVAALDPGGRGPHEPRDHEPAVVHRAGVHQPPAARRRCTAWRR
jgi:hypothetical protein